VRSPRGLANDGPRAKAYRRSALQFALGWVAAAAIVGFVAFILTVLL
jgi:hypothetical protein